MPAASAVLVRELFDPGPRFPAGDTVSPFDVFISPHFDDVCFSLGALVAARGAGILLTVCSQSKHIEADTGTPPDPARWVRHVSALRRGEDATFAQLCGLRQECLDLPEASLRGRMPFDTSKAAEDWPMFEQATLGALTSFRQGGATNGRPWLFCPIGIGGHIDHVAVRTVVLHHWRDIAKHYRIGLYEDLHYASRRWPRLRGLASLQAAAPPVALTRYTIAAKAAEKLALLRLYASQFDGLPDSLDRFTPAHARVSAPHEAIWTSETL
jgi:LmbE family N-acetylglucosaminyl deacetylase